VSPPRGSDPVDPLLGGPTPEPTTSALNGLLVISPDTKLGRRERKQLAFGEQHAARNRHPTSRPIPVVDPDRIIDPELQQRLHPEQIGVEDRVDEEGGRRPARVRRAIWPVLVTALLVAALFVFVFPTRTYLAQRAETRRTEHQLRVLKDQNDALSARVTALDTDAEIERIAREQFDLVRPGEQAFAILPAPALTALPPGFPFDLIRELLERPAAG